MKIGLHLKSKSGHNFKFLTPETMKSLGRTESKITKDKNSENVPHLKIKEVVLVSCKIGNNDYDQNSRVLRTFVPNKPFGSFFEISPASHVFSKTFNSEFQDIEVWFTDENSQSLEIEDRINLILEIKWRICYINEIFSWV